MSAGARINHDSEFGRHERDLSYGEVSHVDIDDPSALALLVGRYGLWIIEGVTEQDKAHLLTSLKQKADTGKDAAIDADDDHMYREFASVSKVAEFYISDGESDMGNDHWDRFHELMVKGSDQERARLDARVAQRLSAETPEIAADIIL